MANWQQEHWIQSIIISVSVFGSERQFQKVAVGRSTFQTENKSVDLEQLDRLHLDYLAFRMLLGAF